MKGGVTALFILLGAVSKGLTQAPQWSYAPTDYSQDPVVNGPLDWSSVSFSCDGGLQSPVDIATSDATQQEYDAPLTAEFNSDDSCNFGDGDICGNLVNNGRALIFQINKERTDLRLRGGPLPDLAEYRLEKIKFHFGCDDDGEGGSEHKLDGKKQVAEMQLMFYKEEFGDYMQANNKPEGLAGISVLLEKGDSQESLGVLENELQNMLNKGTQVEEVQLQLFKLVPDLLNPKAKFFTYQGSMTIPPCSESVRWIIMKNPVKITEDQLAQLRALEATDENAYEPVQMCNNIRTLQELNGREVDKQ